MIARSFSRKKNFVVRVLFLAVMIRTGINADRETSKHLYFVHVFYLERDTFCPGTRRMFSRNALPGTRDLEPPGRRLVIPGTSWVLLGVPIKKLKILEKKMCFCNQRLNNIGFPLRGGLCVV